MEITSDNSQTPQSCRWCGSSVPPKSIFCPMCGHSQRKSTKRRSGLSKVLGLTVGGLATVLLALGLLSHLPESKQKRPQGGKPASWFG